MKYFEKLPKISYDTTIGSFNVVSPFAYYDINSSFIQTQPYEVDSKTTLLEAGAVLYGDANSFWAFLIANNTINPFTLLAQNTDLLKSDSDGKYTFNVTGSTANQYVVLGQRTILIKYDPTQVTGITGTFGQTGAWDLYGDFALVESTNSYNKKITTKPVQGTKGNFNIGATADTMVAFNYTGNSGYAVSTKGITPGAVTPFISSVKASRTPSTGENVIESVADETTPTTSPTITYSVEDVAIQTPKTIKAIVPSQLNKLFNNLIYIKYS
jgi:hypothetical protein